MIRRSLLTATLVLVGSIAMAPKVMAQTADVPFTGSVPGGCNFSQVIPGTLGFDTDKLDSQSFNGGIMGRVVVECNQPANLIVSAPQQTGGPMFTPVESNATLHSLNGGGTTSPGNPSLPLTGTGTPETVDVNMMVRKDTPLTPGNYNYKVTLTITP